MQIYRSFKLFLAIITVTVTLISSGLLSPAFAGGSGTVTLNVVDSTNTTIAGAAITYTTTGTTVIVSGNTVKFTYPNAAPNETFTAPTITGYTFDHFNDVTAGTTISTTTYTKSIKDNFTLTAVYKIPQVTASASFSSSPSGAPNGTFTPTGPFNINTTQSFTVTSPDNWLVSTVKKDSATTGTNMTLSCSSTGLLNSCSFSCDVGSSNSIFYVAMLPYDTAPTIGAPSGAVTTTTVGVTNNIADADGVQNIIYYIYSDAVGTALVSSNTTGSFIGLTSGTDYWIKTSAETKNKTTGAWVSQTSSLVKVTTSAPNYSVILSIASGSGSVTVNAIAATPPVTTTVGTGQSITYTFTADPNYVLSDVKVDNVSQGPVTPFTLSNILGNKTVQVYFKHVWTIAVNAGANGSISPSNPAKVVDGGSQTFTITPATGANILDVLVDSVSQGAITTYTFTNVTSDHTIAATFGVVTSDAGKYSVIPPFIANPIKPNLLLMFDNSASMYDLAYFDSTIDIATGRLKYSCYDTSYSDATSYDGYFDRTSTYSYNTTDNKFQSGEVLDNSCTFKTSYLCVTMADNGSGGKSTTVFKASGNFLNWLTSSKFDVQKKELTGGKFNTTYNYLEGESRGCAGRNYIKEVINPSTNAVLADSANYKLSFGVRGPSSFDPDFVSMSTKGGGTRIDIYRSKDGYNSTACKQAADLWVDGTNLGTWQKPAEDCIAGSSSSPKVQAYVAIVHICYRGLTGGNWQAEINPLQKVCEGLYSDPALGYNNDPSKITSDKAADSICSSVIKHPNYGNGGGNDIGYIGRCASRASGSWKWDSGAGIADIGGKSCSEIEMMDFCGGSTEFDVIDPSSTATTSTGTPVAAPSFLMSAGAGALGDSTRTCLVHVAQSTAPTGIIQDFQPYIIFGAMKFNDFGDSYECNDGTNNTTSPIKCTKVCYGTTTQCYVSSDCAAGVSCVNATKTDGGKVFAYNGYDSVGDHSSGLVNGIDQMQASTWTPWSEAYYNAIGYFANNNSMRLQTGDFDVSKNPSSLVCRQNNILIISDGGSTADQKDTVQTLVGTYAVGSGAVGGQTGACPGFRGSKNLDNLSWLAKNRKISALGTAPDPANSNETITTYTLFTGKEDATQTGECEPKTLMSNTARNGGTTPYVADGGSDFRNKLQDAFAKIASQSSSGTAASILSNSGGSGANLLQAVFYPKKDFENSTSVSWAGELQNLWYYVDPFFSGSTIREDTAFNPLTDTSHSFDISRDKVIQFYFDPNTKQTMLKRFNFDGTTVSALPDDPTNGLKSIWSAGKLLWQRPASDRKIFTLLNSSNFDLTTANYDASASKSLMRTRLASEGADTTAQDTFSDKVISYIRGEDVCLDSSNPCTNPSRSRNVSIKQSDGTNVSNIWKLGDIVSSTPKIQGNLALGPYDQDWPLGYSDTTYKNYINSADYSKRGMVYVGANDGMLHAFRLGTLNLNTNGNVKGVLSGQNLGKEEWAFVPRQALPYLKLLMKPSYSSDHIYSVDGPNMLFDVSTGTTTTRDDYWNETKTASTWKSMLVGGMGIGGACRTSTSACPAASSGTCVSTMSNDWGISQYYALDITNQHYNTLNDTLYSVTPTVKWEFDRHSGNINDLGFTTSGAALVRINAKAVDGTPDTSKNGRWLAVFASGPTGPIDSTEKQFYGKSDQNLKLFVVDIEHGPTTGNYWVIDTGIKYAFGGSITNNIVADTEMTVKGATNQYQDDVLYIGYVRNTDQVNGTGTWTEGGVVRLMIPDTVNPDTLDPLSTDVTKKWSVSTLVDGVGPVTTSIAKLMSSKNLYLYFGSGRYYYRDDNQATQNALYMVKEQCYPIKKADGSFLRSDIDSSCTAPALVLNDLTNRTTGATDTAVDKGWYINLADGERVVTDTVANTSGSIFYTTFTPSTNPCQFGGTTYLWGVKYDTGFQLSANAKKGKALIQLSTGSFAELSLSEALTANEGRRTSYSGSPGGTDGGLSAGGKGSQDAGLIMTPAGLNPVKRILHIQERYK